jgi:hypothetical protein
MQRRPRKERTEYSGKNMFIVGNVAVLYRKGNGSITGVTVLRMKLFKRYHASNEE